MKTLLLALALAACGPNAAEIKTAKTATYKMAPHDMLLLAEDVAQETYKLGDVNEGENTFITQPRWYRAEGDLESPGAAGYTLVRPGSVQVSFIVQVVAFGGGDVGVTVTPKTFQTIAGSPKPRELAPDDPYLPPWVHGRADDLALAIYNRAKPYAYSSPTR